MAEFPERFEAGGVQNSTCGPVIASAATIAPTFLLHHVSGTTTITAITPPWPGFTGTITLIPDGIFSITAGTIIKNGLTAVVNQPILCTFDNVGIITLSFGNTVSNPVNSLSAVQYFDPNANASWAGSVIGIGTLLMQPIVVPSFAAFSAAAVYLSNSFSATNAGSSNGQTQSFTLGVYTRTGNTLSLATSGSVSTAYTVTGSSSSASYQGLKGINIPIVLSAMTPGNYWAGYIYSSASAGHAIMGAESNVVLSVLGAQSVYAGIFGSNSGVSNVYHLGLGSFSVTSAALPASIGFSELLSQVGATAKAAVIFNNFTA